jgi:hypothetical protein
MTLPLNESSLFRSLKLSGKTRYDHGDNKRAPNRHVAVSSNRSAKADTAHY